MGYETIRYAVEGAVATITTVSYTHLDVYKRQALAMEAARDRSGWAEARHQAAW